MDLTKYGASPYGPGSPLRGDQNQSPLAAALRGVLGQEEPGSVLDPATAGLKSINDKANLVSILSDLVPAKGAATLPHAAGIFIGPKAKTWNAQAAAKAAELLRAGHDPEQVRRLTGTSLFPDGRLRQEISDHNAQLTRMLMPDAKPDALGAQLFHPELEAAYPEKMRDVVARLRGSSETGGEYRSGKIKVTADNASNAKSTLLHEIQHNIQDTEGFARGGSPAEFIKDAQWAAKARGLDPSWAEKKAWLDYSKLAGEAEARLVQRRRALTPEERQNTPLEWDVPPESQKVINYDDTAAEVPADKVYAQEIMKSMRQSPQNYAELKVFGHVPLTADNFAGVLAKKRRVPEHVTQALRDRGLHVKTYDQWANEDLAAHANELQALSRQSMTPGFDTDPQRLNVIAEQLRKVDR